MPPQSSSTLVEVAQPAAKVSWSVMPQCRWDDPQLSVGTPHVSLDLLGRFKCWSLKDKSPAHMMWKTVSKAIISLLEDRYEHLDAGGSDLMVEMFMVGRKPRNTSPTILFSCESKTCRQKAMRLVQKKGILKDHTGVLMADCSKLPRPLALVEELDAPLLPPGIYLNGPLRSFGTSVLVYSKEGSPPRKATIGGFVTIEHEIFGVTAAHVFFPIEEDRQDNISDNGDIEFSFFGDEEPYDNGDDEELVDQTSRASISSRSSLSPSMDESENSFPASATSTSNSTLHERVIPATDHAVTDIGGEKTAEKFGDLFISIEAGERLDWALVKMRASSASFQATHILLQSNLAWQEKVIYPKSVENATSKVKVLISTGSGGVVEGTLSAVASFSINTNTHSSQSLLTVRRSNGKFSDGDCGSWVFDKETGDVYGHIVSGFPATGIAYIVPSMQIFQDIKRRISKPVDLFTREAYTARDRISENSDPITRRTVNHEIDYPLSRRHVRYYDLDLEEFETRSSTSAPAIRAEPVPTQIPARTTVIPRPAYVVDVDSNGESIDGTRKTASTSTRQAMRKRLPKGKGRKKVGDKADAIEIKPKTAPRVTPSRYSINSNSSHDSGYASYRHSTVSSTSSRVSDIQEDEGEWEDPSNPGSSRMEAVLWQRHWPVRGLTNPSPVEGRLGQPMPIRPRAITAQPYPIRPMSYHASLTTAGYGPPLSASAWSNYNSSSHTTGQERGANNPDRRAGRPFSSGYTGGIPGLSAQTSTEPRYSVGEETDDDDGYASTPEGSTKDRSLIAQSPFLPHSAVDIIARPPAPRPVLRNPNSGRADEDNASMRLPGPRPPQMQYDADEYQSVLGRPPPQLLTAEILGRYHQQHGQRVQSSSSSAGRSIRSNSSDGWRSSSTAPTDYGDSENLTIKVSGTARLMVGGAEIDSPSGEVIIIRPGERFGRPIIENTTLNEEGNISKDHPGPETSRASRGESYARNYGEDF